VGDRITYVGHSTVRLELGGTTLLTDPLTRRRFLHAVRQVPPVAPAVTDGVDAVLASHLHMDHLDFPSMKPLGTDVELVVPAGGARVVARRGYRNATELRPGDVTRVGSVEVTATEADHDGRRWPLGPSVEALGFVLRGAGHSLYFAGDTDLFDGMAELGEIDVALLPIGGWGPKQGTSEGHLDARSAAEAVALIRPRIAVPIHWGTYLRRGLAGRREKLLGGPPREFAAEVARRAPETEARVLAPGESLDLR
jgi:L-ascorbate metabolism protein UlaG (beta-lactamase superfamily)